MRDDLDELRGKAFDLLIQRVCPKVRGEGGTGRPAKGILSPQNLLGVDVNTVLLWRNGERIPRESTLRRIMPNLTAFGIPEEVWMEAREISIRTSPRYRKRTFDYPRCNRGHELALDSAGRCKECRHLRRLRDGTGKGHPVGSSGYRGVTRRQQGNRNPWAAKLRYDGRSRHIGNYATAEEAARAFDAKVKELGLNRRLNFPEE